MAIPRSFPAPAHLPFNRTSLARRFQLSNPGQDPGGRGVWLLLHDDCLLVSGDDDPRLPEFDAEFARGLFFGYWDDQPCRAALLPSDSPVPHGLRAESLGAIEPLLPITLLSLGGLGKMLLHWDKHSRHCPVCGAAMTPGERDWGKVCVACATYQYPHVAPCAIVLVRRPGEFLLVRRPEYAPQRYGLVAGFIECGECLEEAAAREVAEETGVKIANLRYVGSQCWPFPSQLMCGFVADYAGGEISVQTRELVDARWFPLDALPTLPPKRSIARYILDTELS
ncbi:MAG: NAD(+) diphosphatase [Desulfuromonadales bacterium]